MKYPEILSVRSEPVVCTYTDKDTILYALGIGMGADPLNAQELPFVYEQGLRAVPTMSAVLTTGAGKVLAEAAINFMMMLHGEQRLRVHRPLPPEARIATSGRCLSVVDKGKTKGAVLNIEGTIADAATGYLYSTAIMSLFCRGDGGFGGPSENPLITYGFACRAVMQAYCNFDQTKIKTFDARFSAPVYPGETIVTRLWKSGSVVSFECGVAERGVTAISNGRCELAE